MMGFSLFTFAYSVSLPAHSLSFLLKGVYFILWGGEEKGAVVIHLVRWFGGCLTPSNTRQRGEQGKGLHGQNRDAGY